jgi:hypothetical protein
MSTTPKGSSSTAPVGAGASVSVGVEGDEVKAVGLEPGAAAALEVASGVWVGDAGVAGTQDEINTSEVKINQNNFTDFSFSKDRGSGLASGQLTFPVASL